MASTQQKKTTATERWTQPVPNKNICVYDVWTADISLLKPNISLSTYSNFANKLEFKYGEMVNIFGNILLLNPPY